MLYGLLILILVVCVCVYRLESENGSPQLESEKIINLWHATTDSSYQKMFLWNICSSFTFKEQNGAREGSQSMQVSETTGI